MNSIEKLKTWYTVHKTEIRAGATTIATGIAVYAIGMYAGAAYHKIRLDNLYKSTVGVTAKEFVKRLDSGMLSGETYSCYMSNPGVYGKNITIQDCGKLGQELASFVGKEIVEQTKEVSGVVLMMHKKK